MARVTELSTLSTQFDLPQNRLYEIRDALIKRGTRFTDLISGNVSAQGLTFPPALLRSALAQAVEKTKVYRPDPLGRLEAREAIRQYYAKSNLSVPVDQILLTSGTSLSYLYVFKVIANPGDEILVPTPSYPLFDSIMNISQVKGVPYRLRESRRWSIDFDDMDSRVTAKTKGIVLISPHNPTGAVATVEEVAQLGLFAARHKLAILSDEVFSPFVYTGLPLARPARSAAPLVYTLNGFSKMLALPGIKLGWIAVTGDPDLVRKSMRALDMISDTFLPVSEITQAAAGSLLLKSQKFQKDVVHELKDRRDLAVKLLGCTSPEGGFVMALPLPHGQDEETFACRLLEKKRVLVHPGFFYDMEGRHIVVSFVSRKADLERALRAVTSEWS